MGGGRMAAGTGMPSVEDTEVVGSTPMRRTDSDEGAASASSVGAVGAFHESPDVPSAHADMDASLAVQPVTA